MKSQYFGLTKQEAVLLIHNTKKHEEKIPAMAQQAHLMGVRHCYEEMVEGVPDLSQTICAMPPMGYQGSLETWRDELAKTSYWDGKGFYGSVQIPVSLYWYLIGICDITILAGEENDEVAE